MGISRGNGAFFGDGGDRAACSRSQRGKPRHGCTAQRGAWAHCGVVATDDDRTWCYPQARVTVLWVAVRRGSVAASLREQTMHLQEGRLQRDRRNVVSKACSTSNPLANRVRDYAMDETVNANDRLVPLGVCAIQGSLPPRVV